MPPLNNMRKYHNDIKRQYINKYIVKRDSSLLDLACGKGGDLNKWISNKNIAKVNGYDINEKSIIEAKRRLATMKVKRPIITFNVQNLATIPLNCEDKYDYITSFFAFHYFFHSQKTLNTILKSIDSCSKKDTVLVLALFNGDKIIDVKDKNYSITKLDIDKKGNYGHRVSVYIAGSVLNTPTIEYIVKPNFLIKKMKTINFELIEQKDFDINSKLSQAERYLSSLNTIFVFQKKN